MLIKKEDVLHMHRNKNSYFMINFLNAGLDNQMKENVFKIETEPKLKIESV